MHLKFYFVSYLVVLPFFNAHVENVLNGINSTHKFHVYFKTQAFVVIRPRAPEVLIIIIKLLPLL